MPEAIPPPRRRLRVGVLFGGRSGEHEVSLQSARAVMTALGQAGHEVVPIGITKQGRWLASGDPHAALSSGTASGELAATMLPEPGQTGLVGRSDAASTPGGPLDVVFPVLHGTFGEDGTVQGLFELAGLPYVGSGVLGSALGMDKIVQKMLWRGLGLPIVDFVGTSRREIERDPDAIVRQVEASLGYPCFTKPANLGSSVGVAKARNADDLRRGLAEAASFDSRVIVEHGVNARELEVGVLGNDEPLTSVVGEIVANAEFYDYRAKYLDSGSQAIIPAKVPPGVADEVQRLAVSAFRSVSAAGLARVDFFLDRDTARLYLNEVNTMPGFTRISMYPKLWEASGVSFGDLVDRLVQLGLERHAESARNRTSYAPD